MDQSGLIIHPIPALRDNYIWAIIDDSRKLAAIIDPGEAQPVLDYLKQNELQLSAILITHHHWDHTNGLTELLKLYQVPVYGPDNPAIEGISHPVHEGDTINLEPLPLILSVMEIPGHTLDHIAYYGSDMLFCGDTLFSAGCGRTFEGTGQQMYDTLQKIAHLPDATKIYCAHEYTLNNLHFAQITEPGNHFIKHHISHIENLRSRNEVTLPSTLQLEKKINPFLRCNSPELIRIVEKYSHMPLPSPVEIFIHLRKWKDHF